MNCKKFQELINDFIFDKIEYSEDLEEFLDHAKNCQACSEELSLYYTIHRGLGDAPAPSDSEEVTDVDKELENIFSFYDEYFEKQRFMKKAGKISIAVFGVVVICTAIYIYIRVSGYL
ncbi:MAG: hypothetical protein ACLRZ9_06120 [Eubacterium sp.]